MMEATGRLIKNTNGKATFPAVNLGSANMVLGWSKTQGKNALSSSDYKAGDRIPTKNGKILHGHFWDVYGSCSICDHKSNKV